MELCETVIRGLFPSIDSVKLAEIIDESNRWEDEKKK